jgi:hypothetical protein
MELSGFYGGGGSGGGIVLALVLSIRHVQLLLFGVAHHRLITSQADPLRDQSGLA